MRRSLRRRVRSNRRPSRRSRKSLLLVFALIFAPALARPARAACVEFSKPPAISTIATTAVSVAAGDVDGDGDLDAISASYSDNKIAWYRNDGSGGGWTIVTISTGAAGATSVAVADLDRDGDLDALSSSWSDNTIAWYENLNGAGTSWSAHDITTQALGAQSVAVGDVDGDGDPDAVAALYTSGQIVWYRNDNDDTDWAANTASNLSYAVTFVSTADVDGDGSLDILSATWQDRIAWHKNYGAGVGVFGLKVVATEADLAESVEAFDLDGDGDLDVVSASAGDDKIAWYVNDDGGGESWYEQSISNSATGVTEARVADFDADGDGDVLAASFGGGKVAWYENFGVGTGWVTHTITTGANGAASVFAADLDADGDLDALAAVGGINQIAWYRNDRLHDQELLLPTTTISAAAGAYSVVPADIDGDGSLDAVAAAFSADDVVWYQNDGSPEIGLWVARSIALDADGAYSVAAADLDRDGDLDVLSASFDDDKIAWYQNDGSPADGGWTLHTISLVANGARFVVAADLNRDGDLDVVSASTSDDKIAWYENDGSPADGGWVLRTISLVASDALSVFAADLDRDGDLDVLSTSGGDGKVAWYENDGTPSDGGWVLRSISLAASGARSVVAANLDGDGDLDVLSASLSDDKIAWYENDGTPADGGWVLRSISLAADGAVSVFAADLEGDGDLDVLSASFYDNKIAWYENDGSPADGGWVSRTISLDASFATSVSAADVDRDGDLDVLSTAFFTNLVAWYPNLGTGVFDDGFDSDANPSCWSDSMP